MAATTLILGSRPIQEEVNKGFPFASKYYDSLRAEFGRLNFEYRTCRIGYLWPHVRPDKKADQHCLEWGWERVLQEARGRKNIFAMGEDLAVLLTGAGALDWCGLPVRSSQIAVPIYISVDPNTIGGRGPGEFRYALGEFRKSMRGSR